MVGLGSFKLTQSNPWPAGTDRCCHFWPSAQCRSSSFGAVETVACWSQSRRVLAMPPAYRPKKQNQTNMRVLVSILAVFHNLTNGIKRGAPHAPISRITLGRSASGAVASFMSIYGIYGSRSSGGNDVVSILTTCDGWRVIPRRPRLVRTYRRRHFRRWVQCR